MVWGQIIKDSYYSDGSKHKSSLILTNPQGQVDEVKVTRCLARL